MKTKKGFTLLELLMVIMIIGILATVVVVNLTVSQKKARDSKRVADLQSIQSAVEMYRQTSGKLPGGTASYYQSNYNPNWTLHKESQTAPDTADDDKFAIDLAAYLSSLPIDPKNGKESIQPWTQDTTGLAYRYQQNGSKYKLDAGMETREDLVANDGGEMNSTGHQNGELIGRYEIGTELHTLMPTF